MGCPRAGAAWLGHSAGEDSPLLELLPLPHPSGPVLLEIPVPEKLQNFLRLYLFIPDWTTPGNGGRPARGVRWTVRYFTGHRLRNASFAGIPILVVDKGHWPSVLFFT